MNRGNIPILSLLLLLLAGMLVFGGCATVQTHEGPDSKVSIRELDRSKETAIKTAFKHDKVLAGEDIQVKVINLEVTLSGTVETEEYKEQAGKIAMGVPGIKKVENNLDVRKR